MSESKQSLREEIWTSMTEAEVTLFPGAEGRIPNFKGREQARDKLTDHEDYRTANAIKINPDSPQTPVRERAFADGKILYMAVPKLRERQCFIELDPNKIDARPDDIGSIKGANKHGRPIHPSDMDPVDLIVTGAVGVDGDGHRLGKGGGYSDLEFSILLEFGLIDRDIPIWTTVHSLQVLEPGRIPRESNDITLSGIASTHDTHLISNPPSRPRGIETERLDDGMIEAIPILDEMIERA